MRVSCSRQVMHDYMYFHPPPPCFQYPLCYKTFQKLAMTRSSKKPQVSASALSQMQTQTLHRAVCSTPGADGCLSSGLQHHCHLTLRYVTGRMRDPHKPLSSSVHAV
jgi:hypothetical protein